MKSKKGLGYFRPWRTRRGSIRGCVSVVVVGSGGGADDDDDDDAEDEVRVRVRGYCHP